MFRGFTVGKARAKELRLDVSCVLSSSLGLTVVGISLNREWRAGRPSCGRRDGIFIELNIGKPPIRNAISAPPLRCAEENRERRREREREREGGRERERERERERKRKKREKIRGVTTR